MRCCAGFRSPFDSRRRAAITMAWVSGYSFGVVNAPYKSRRRWRKFVTEPSVLSCFSLVKSTSAKMIISVFALASVNVASWGNKCLKVRTPLIEHIECPRCLRAVSCRHCRQSLHNTRFRSREIENRSAHVDSRFGIGPEWHKDNLRALFGEHTTQLRNSLS